jgi:hypothetical protein
MVCMVTTDSNYPLDALRVLALHTQGLTTPADTGAPPTCDALYEVVERLG